MMNRKQKIIVSITGIFLVLMILVGLTYAYFLTKITGNTNTKSISVSTANLVLEYGENTNVVQGISNAEPGYSVEKIFTATNKGNSTVTYGAALESIVNELSRQEDLVYTLTCTSYLKEGFSLASDGTITGTVDGTCNGVSTEKQFPSTSTLSVMVTNTIDTTHTQAYKLTITYKEMNVDQSTDMNKTFSAKVNIVDINALTVNNPYKNDTGTLKKAIIDNAMLGIYNTIYRDSPLTEPGKESTTIIVKDIDPTTFDMTLSNAINYYVSYSDNYILDEKTGSKKLDNSNSGIKVVKYSKAIVNTLKGKYACWSNANSEPIYDCSLVKISTNDKDFADNSFKYAYIYETFGSKETTLSKTIDDYGDSYYFRGGILNNNYVNFAGMCWRIVRIQGDGSIKISLENKEKTCKEANGTFSGSIGSPNYGYDLSDGKIFKANYLNPVTNTSDAMVNIFKNFQNTLATKIVENYSSKNISNYLNNSGWCLNENAYKSGSTNLNSKVDRNQYYNNNTDDFDYDTKVRLVNSENIDLTLKCKGNTINKYADDTDMYVATITADEVLFSGYDMKSQIPSRNYLHFGWTLSLSYYQINYGDYAFVMSSSGGSLDSSNDSPDGVSTTKDAIPVIQLKSDVKVTGNGTIDNPYVVQ